MRLIDGDALWNKAEEMYIHTKSGKIIPVMAVPTWAINNAPTVDAVPVVRCKDCKSFKEYTPEFKASNECVEGADGDCITRLLYSDAHPQFSAVRNSDYCSLGVKINLEGCP